MEPTHSIKPDEISYELITQAQIKNSRWKNFRSNSWPGKITRGKILALAALLMLVLSVGLADLRPWDFAFTLPFLGRSFSPGPANQGAVLAVDVHRLIIRGKNISPVARARLEQATVKQLARLHPIYLDWAATDEEAVGTMLVELHVDGTGKVVRIEPLRTRLPSAGFSKVVLDEISGWNISGSPAQPVKIILPLLFVPKGLDANTVVRWERRTRDNQAERRITDPAQSGRPVRTSPVMMPPASAIRSSASPAGGVSVEALNVAKPKSPKLALSVVKTTRPLALRQQPRFAAERIHDIDADTELSLLERKGNWRKVRLTDAAIVGFVRKEYLTPLN